MLYHARSNNQFPINRIQSPPLRPSPPIVTRLRTARLRAPFTAYPKLTSPFITNWSAGVHTRCSHRHARRRRAIAALGAATRRRQPSRSATAETRAPVHADGAGQAIDVGAGGRPAPSCVPRERAAINHPRRYAPLCRPEVGVPSRPRASSRSAVPLPAIGEPSGPPASPPALRSPSKPPPTARLRTPSPPRSPPRSASAMPRSGGGGPWWGRPASPAGHRPR